VFELDASSEVVLACERVELAFGEIVWFILITI
jgi:hypothetical protein